MIKNTKGEVKVSVLIFKDGEHWVAQGLEHDIVAQGSTISAARRSFEKTVAGQIYLDLNDGKAVLSDIPKAPSRYWKIFEEKDCQRIVGSSELPGDVPACHIIDSEDWDMRICA